MRRSRITYLRTPEKAIQQAVLQHWRELGVEGSLVAAVPNAGSLGQPGLTKGIFDLLVIGGNIPGGLGFIELKTDKGILSAAQERFKQLLIRNAIPYAVTYGRDEPIRVLEEWGVVRRAAT